MICRIEEMLYGNVREAILHGDDDEFYLGLSRYQTEKTRNQLRHIAKSLKIISEAHEKNNNLTWRDACIKSGKELLAGIGGRSIEIWYLTFKSNNYKLPISKQGIARITKDKNPFLQLVDEDSGKTYRDNEDIYTNLRTWALENLEILSIALITNKVNELLADNVKEDPSFLTTYNLTYPIKPFSVRRWMDDMEFKYARMWL